MFLLSLYLETTVCSYEAQLITTQVLGFPVASSAAVQLCEYVRRQHKWMKTNKLNFNVPCGVTELLQL